MVDGFSQGSDSRSMPGPGCRNCLMQQSRSPRKASSAGRNRQSRPVHRPPRPSISDRQNLTVYYYFNDIRQLSPFNQFEQAGANVPGFGNFNNNRFQQWNISHTFTLSSSVVNEARFTYMREGELGFLKPQVKTPSRTPAPAPPKPSASPEPPTRLPSTVFSRLRGRRQVRAELPPACRQTSLAFLTST